MFNSKKETENSLVSKTTTLKIYPNQNQDKNTPANTLVTSSVKLVMGICFFISFTLGGIAIGLTINTLITTQSFAQTPASRKTLIINYKDYNNILKGLILHKGAPSRKAPNAVPTPTGTRISYASKKITRLEANRVMFHNLEEGDKLTIHNARLDLEAFPSIHPLQKFSKNEQLAYWLNLRNLVVLDAVTKAYPVMKLKKVWSRLENDKRLSVAGTPLSINDIEALIIAKWPRPEVIYGFYNGSIGGPNIRETAFTGKTVWADLKENAKEFTNSLRGIQFRNNTTKVSDLYKRYREFFPNFNDDLRNHLLSYLNKSLALKLQKTASLKPTINDWNIADLMNGRLGLGSSIMLSPAALIFGMTQAEGNFKSTIMQNSMNRIALQKWPTHVQDYLIGRQKRIFERKGIVIIDEVESPTTNIEVKQDEKKK